MSSTAQKHLYLHLSDLYSNEVASERFHALVIPCVIPWNTYFLFLSMVISFSSWRKVTETLSLFHLPVFKLVKISFWLCLIVAHQTLIDPKSSCTIPWRKECCTDFKNNLNKQALLGFPSQSISNHTYALESSWKLKRTVWRSSDSRVANFETAWKLHVPFLILSSKHLFIYTLYNELVNLFPQIL